MSAHFSINKIQLLLLSMTLGVLGLTLSPNSAAAQIVVELTVNGGSGAEIINGQPVDLEWYIDGAVTNCSISDGSTTVVPSSDIDLSVKPATGARQVTPPANATVQYSLTCDGGSSSVIVSVAPIIDIWTEPASPVTNDPLLGHVKRIDLRWSATLANRCGPAWREDLSNPGVRIYAGPDGTSVTKSTNGAEWYFDGDENGFIDESTTFYVECNNDANMTTSVASTTVIVSNPTSLPTPILSVWNRGTDPVVRDQILGWATAYPSFSQQNFDTCSYARYYENGDPFVGTMPGWWTGSSWQGQNWIVSIATTTRFEVTCNRPAITLGTTTYPAVEQTESILINVIDPDNAGDRASISPVIAYFEVNPNPTTKSPLTGEAVTQVVSQPQFAQICNQRAYRFSDNASINVPGWGHQINGLNNATHTIRLATTTRLELYCERSYDLENFPLGSPEHNNASATYSHVVDVLESATSAPPYQTFIYGNSVVMLPQDLRDNATSISNFVVIGNRLESGTWGPSVSTVEFDFDHPTDSTDIYNVHLRYCDESDGVENTFTVTAGGQVATVVTDDSSVIGTGACGADTEKSKLILTGVSLSDGDPISVECESTEDGTVTTGEKCRLLGLYFGAGDGGTVVTPVDPVDGFATAEISWITENQVGGWCYDHWATPTGGGTPYDFTSKAHWVGTESLLLPTTTVFSIECRRNIQGTVNTDASAVEVILPSSGSVTATGTVASGDCIDQAGNANPANPHDILADPNDLGVRSTLPGEMRDSGGFCVAAIDLSAKSPAMSYASAIENNIDGTYDSLDALLVIENQGEGELPSASNITYAAELTFIPAIQSLFGISNPYGSTDGIGTYNGAITAPTMAGSPPVASPATESPTLTRTFDGVPFGDHVLCSRVNLDDPPLFPEWNPDFSNNTSCSNVSLPVPRPPMTLETTGNEIIRSGQTAEIVWSAHTTYPLNCTIQGPGGISDAFDASSNPPNPAGGSQITTALTSTSRFLLTCTEPITGTVFTEELVIEVVPDSEEI